MKDKNTAKEDNLEHGWGLFKESITLFPAGILLSFNPFTIIIGGSILSGFFEGIIVIFKNLFKR